MENQKEKPKAIEMLAAAQTEAQANVIRDRVALITSLLYLKKIHAEDDVHQSVREILSEHGTLGVPMQLLRVVHSDAKQLDAAVEKLKEAGLAKEEKVGKVPVLKAA